MNLSFCRSVCRSVFAGLLRRPDVLVGLASLAIVVPVYWLTPLSLRFVDRVIFDRLASAFGAGVFTVTLFIFVHLLLRHAPPQPARTLRLAWLVLVPLVAVGLLFAYPHPEGLSTSWILQALLLASLGLGWLLCLLAPSLGLVRWRDLRTTTAQFLRSWGGVFIYIMTGGYLLSIVRSYSPLVYDPLLFKMDASLGWRAVESIASWNSETPLARFITTYSYPLLGFFIAAVGAGLHLAGAYTALRRYLWAVVFIPLFGVTCYWVIPAVGPWYIYPTLLAPGAEGDPAALALRASILAGPDTVPFRLDVARNVMPSLHTAFSLVALIAAWRHRRGFFFICLPLGFLQIATTLTHGVHYLVDLFAAVPLVVLCWSLAEAATRRFPLSTGPALPPIRDPDRAAWLVAGSLMISLGALVCWGALAPLPPGAAWTLAALVVIPPAASAWQVFRQRDPIPVSVTPSPASAPALGRLLGGSVFCTGGTALVLEQVAEKYLTTLLGASRPAATLVLVVYFVGLAAGAALCPKKSAGAARRLAGLELFVAVWCALLATAFFTFDRPLGEWLAGQDGSAGALAAARAAIAALWLLPPTVAMGAQLPTLAALLRASPALAGLSLARLYALNLAGAATFCFIAPPLLFNLVGAQGALWCTAALAGLVGLMLWSGLPRDSATAAEPAPSLAPAPVVSMTSLGAAFSAGLLFFVLEIVWFHLISAVCGASTYSFSLLLGLILLGLALAGRHAARSASLSSAALLAALALVLALTSPLWPWLSRAMHATNSVLELEWFWAGEALKTFAVAVLVLPPAVLLGQIFPRLLRDHTPDGVGAGRLALANTLGCVSGALLAGLLLIPRLGAERTLIAAGLLTAALALAQWRGLSPSGRGLALAGLALPLLLPAWDRLELTRGRGVYLGPGLPPDARLVWFREDFHAGFVTVAEQTTASGRTVRTLLQNGKFDADDGGEMAAQVGFGLVAALHSPDTRRALVVGAGSGQTASILARLGFARVDIAELSPAHLAAAEQKFSHINADLFLRPNVNVFLEDGRNLLLRTREPYDVVQIEITSLWFAGATNLYSREFYELARSRLSPGGVLVQWVQLHHLGPREIATVLATARAVFPHVAVWRVGQQACFVATVAPPRANLVLWRNWLVDPLLKAERTASGLVDAEALGRHELLTPAELDTLLHRHRGAYGINTDRNRWLEFRSPQYYLDRRDLRAANLRWLQSVRPTPPVSGDD